MVRVIREQAAQNQVGDAAAERQASVIVAAKVDAAVQARHRGLSGGCFFNRLLTQRLTDALRAAELAVHLPQADRGDAGLALGQAWVAAHAMAAGHDTEPMETTACA